MGLKLELKKNQNHLYMDLPNCYWYLKDVQYGTAIGMLELCAYPSKEAKDKYYTEIEEQSAIGFGGCIKPIVDNELYTWSCQFVISEVFPNGIPLDSDTQKTILYNWIKEYTKLNWEDVLED